MNSDSQTNAKLARLSVDAAWSLLLAARGVLDSTDNTAPCGFSYDESASGKIVLCEFTDDLSILRINDNHKLSYSDSVSAEVKALFDLYLPFLSVKNTGSMVIGHLGQSLDAQIATESGDAFFVTGPENRKHLHRMRALAHAVVVGVETVETDDPQLTTRDVDGKHPVRVVLDPTARMSKNAGIAGDCVAPTWIIQGEDTKIIENTNSGLRRIGVRLRHGRMKMNDVITALSLNGIKRVFVEGGGLTVSCMLTENCLDYFQLAAAPVFVGAGRPSVQLPSVMTMNKAFRPPYALYRMGGDVLWDFDLRNIDASESGIASRQSFDASVGGLPGLERLF